MSLCYRDLSRECEGIHKDCIDCILDQIRAEIEEKYSNYDICEWFEDYDYEENDVSEYRLVGGVSDILAIIDRYRAESGGERGEH